MKPGTENKLKFKQLKRALKLPHWQIVGILETLWRVTEANAPAGDIGRLTDDEIAAAIEWEGDPTSLVITLIDLKWLDRDDDFRLIVHDWSVHCPNHLKGAFVKNHLLFADEIARQRAKQPARHDTRDTAKQPACHPATSPILSVPNQSNQPTSQPKALAESPGNGSAGRSAGVFEQTWEAVAERLVAAGVERAGDAIAKSKENGCKPAHAHHVIDFALQSGFGPGAIVDRLKQGTPTMGVNRGWPNTDSPSVVAKRHEVALQASTSERVKDLNDSHANALIKKGKTARKTEAQIKAEIASAGLQCPEWYIEPGQPLTDEEKSDMRKRIKGEK